MRPITHWGNLVEFERLPPRLRWISESVSSVFVSRMLVNRLMSGCQVRLPSRVRMVEFRLARASQEPVKPKVVDRAGGILCGLPQATKTRELRVPPWLEEAMEDLRSYDAAPDYSTALPAIAADLSTPSRQPENRPDMRARSTFLFGLNPLDLPLRVAASRGAWQTPC